MNNKECFVEIPSISEGKKIYWSAETLEYIYKEIEKRRKMQLIKKH